MAAAIKHLVSQKKKRFEAEGFDLDLTYITERIIAMGFPAESLEGVYRNAMPDVQRFFETRHAGHYLIVNLCSERHYEAEKFKGAVRCFPFDDHNAPPVELIKSFCDEAQRFLDADPANVVAVHCKAGKGRTGVMVSCLLLHRAITMNEVLEGNSAPLNTADLAQAYFDEARTEDAKGVTIPSQKRYVQYYERLLKGQQTIAQLNARTVTLTKIVMNTVPNFDVGGGCDPYVVVHKGDATLFTSEIQSHKKKEGSITFDINQALSGDIKFVFYDKDIGADDKMCWCWLNMGYLSAEQGDIVIIPRAEVDGAVKDKQHHHFADDMHLAFHFTRINQ